MRDENKLHTHYTHSSSSLLTLASEFIMSHRKMTIYIYILWVFLVTPGGMMAFSFPTGMEPRPSAFGGPES